MTDAVTILDGPIGTLLNAWGLTTPEPIWTGDVSLRASDFLTRAHGAYADAGATVHTAATFRTNARVLPSGWEEAAHRAVACARHAVPSGHRIAGSLAPWEDCYRPDLAPEDALRVHRPLAAALASSGVDLLLCETFCNPDEGIGATLAALETGLEVWTSFSAGPDGSLMTPERMAGAASEAASLGASAVMVNCVGACAIQPFVDAVSSAGVPFGVSASAGRAEDGIGWSSPDGDVRFGPLVAGWIEQGAAIIGGCCGMTPAHTRTTKAICGGSGNT